MTSHHQISDVLDALAQHQLVVFVGARGTGKTQLLEQVYERLERSGVRVISLDAAAAQAASDLTAPLGELLGCAPDRLTATNLPEDARVRVLIDNCDALHEKTWFAAVQDEWRGVLGEPEARGRVALLVAGRPLFRHVAEGRGSPLVGIGSFLPSRPLTTTEIRKLGISELVAEKVRVKTGGHPQLTRRLVEAIGGDVDNLGSRYVEFATSQRRFLLQLIDDHGSAGRAVLADLLDAPRGTPVAQSAILARHFGGAGVLGEDTLSDLVASGLIEREGKSCRVAAEILRTDRDLRQYLAAPLFEITDEPTPACVGTPLQDREPTSTSPWRSTCAD